MVKQYPIVAGSLIAVLCVLAGEMRSQFLHFLRDALIATGSAFYAFTKLFLRAGHARIHVSDRAAQTEDLAFR